jgi:hypothetical protein
MDRATLLCTFQPEMVDETVSSYWDGTHQIHMNYGG